MLWSDIRAVSAAHAKALAADTTLRAASRPVADDTPSHDGMILITDWDRLVGAGQDAGRERVLDYRTVFAAEVTNGTLAGQAFLLVEVTSTRRADDPMAFLPKTGLRCLAITAGSASSAGSAGDTQLVPALVPATDIAPRIHVELLTHFRDWDEIGRDYAHGARRWRVLSPDEAKAKLGLAAALTPQPERTEPVGDTAGESPDADAMGAIPI